MLNAMIRWVYLINCDWSMADSDSTLNNTFISCKMFDFQVQSEVQAVLDGQRCVIYVLLMV